MGIGDWGLGIGDWGLGVMDNDERLEPQGHIPIVYYFLSYLILIN